jgi:hypothetical protein
MVHFIGKDIIYFHTLFWPAMLHGAGLRMPTAVNVHGFLTVDGAKMSKSRGTFVNARTYLDHLDADYLRYYLASMLGPTLADIDLDLKAFEERVNSHLVGKWVNIASRCAGFVHKYFDGKLAARLPDTVRARYDAAAAKLEACAARYESRDYAAAMRLIVEVADEANAYVADHAPWVMARDESKRDELHIVLTLALNYFRLLAIWLAPAVPATAARAFDFLDDTPTRFDAADEPLLDHAIRPFKTLASRHDRSFEGIAAAKPAGSNRRERHRQDFRAARSRHHLHRRFRQARPARGQGHCVRVRGGFGQAAALRTRRRRTGQTPDFFRDQGRLSGTGETGRPQRGVHRQPRSAQDALRPERRHDPFGRHRRQRPLPARCR